MTAVYKEFARTDEHGVTSRELNRLVDDIHDFLIAEHESGGTVCKVTVNVTVLKKGKDAA